MVITDLKKTCARCRGTGHQPGFMTMGVSQINYDGRCPACRGRGYALTELGQDLLNLLRPFIEEMMAEEAKRQADAAKTREGKPAAPAEGAEE